MKRYLMIASLFGLVMMLGSTEAIAQRGYGGGGGWRNGGGGCGGFGPRMITRLNLSDQQRAEIERLRNEINVNSKLVLDKLDSLRAQMRQQWASENPDEDVIGALHAKMNPLRQTLRDMRTQFRLDVLVLLNQEQKAAYRNLVGTGGCSYGALGRGNRNGRRGGGGMGKSW